MANGQGNGMFGQLGAQAAGRMVGEALVTGRQQAQEQTLQRPTLDSELEDLQRAVLMVGNGIEELVKRIQPVSTPIPQGNGDSASQHPIQPAAGSVALAIREQRLQLNLLSSKLSFAIAQLEI